MANNVGMLRLLLAADPSLMLLRDRQRHTPLHAALRAEGSVDAARCLLQEAPLQPADEILEMLAAAEDAERVQPLYACLAARQPLSPEQWARVPPACPSLGGALLIVLQRSTAEACLLVHHLPPVEQARLRTLALCLHRTATRRPTRRSPRLPTLPTPLVLRLLALSAANP